MSRARLIGGLLVLGLVATGCAGLHKSASATSGGNPLSPKTITVSAPNATALLHLGDTLVFRPSLELMPPGLRWNLVSFPQGMLTLDSKPGTFPFEFTATHSGVGQVQATVGPPCGGKPGPVAAGVQCPVLGVGSGSAVTGMPVRMVAITVKVYAQGAG
jgi:hypothetical protein